jgi:hypothetical protein
LLVAILKGHPRFDIKSFNIDNLSVSTIFEMAEVESSMQIEEEDDFVIQSFDLYTNEALSGCLNVIQYAGGTADARISMVDQEEPVEVRFKSESGLIQMRLPLETDRSTYSSAKARELIGSPQLEGTSDHRSQSRSLASYIIAGSPATLSSIGKGSFDEYGNPISGNTKEHSRAFVCSLLESKDDAVPSGMYMTPVDRFITLRPSLEYIDEAETRAKQSARRSAALLAAGESTSVQNNQHADGLRSVNVATRRRETSEQTQARLFSYAHLQKRINDEAWNEAVLDKGYPQEAGIMHGGLVPSSSVLNHHP